MANPASSQPEKMRSIYRLQAHFYDVTRWAFLFGRERVLRKLGFGEGDDFLLLEVGCGTGRNLARLARRHPDARFVGLDVSPDMLEKARKKLRFAGKKVQFLEQSWEPTMAAMAEKPDAILFSYALTMFNPGWEGAILLAKNALSEGGKIAVADFHFSKNKVWRWWMWRHNVRLDGQVLPFLEQHFEAVVLEKRRGWWGLWSYFVFVGRAKSVGTTSQVSPFFSPPAR